MLPICSMQQSDSHLSPLASCSVHVRSSTILTVHNTIFPIQFGLIFFTVYCKVIAGLCVLWSCRAFFREELS